jgi:hypothetical protein
MVKLYAKLKHRAPNAWCTILLFNKNKIIESKTGLDFEFGLGYSDAGFEIKKQLLQQEGDVSGSCLKISKDLNGNVHLSNNGIKNCFLVCMEGDGKQQSTSAGAPILEGKTVQVS